MWLISCNALFGLVWFCERQPLGIEIRRIVCCDFKVEMFMELFCHFIG
jgi:hypothetical protein